MACSELGSLHTVQKDHGGLSFSFSLCLLGKNSFYEPSGSIVQYVHLCAGRTGVVLLGLWGYASFGCSLLVRSFARLSFGNLSLHDAQDAKLITLPNTYVTLLLWFLAILSQGYWG